MMLHFDCASGASGDMTIAALAELVARRDGVEPVAELVRPALAEVGVEGGLVQTHAVRRGGLAARAFVVEDAPGFATFAELVAAVASSRLPEAVKNDVTSIAGRMAAAEASVHGGEDEHLHELAGVDTIVDLVGASVLVRRLAPAEIVASPPALGGGLVTTAHGVVPVPAPAVLELLAGSPTAGVSADQSLGELTTPTGAALLAHFVDRFAPLPPCRVRHVGYGAGTRDVPGRPNVLRAVLADPGEEYASFAGRSDAHAGHVLLETNVDDMTPELLAHAAGIVRDAGALDVWLTPALMKKGRPASVLHVLAAVADGRRLADVVFAETSSFGLRVTPVTRWYAAEERRIVRVEGCEIRVRLASVDGRVATVSPEYEDVAAAATLLQRPAKVVYEAAQAAARSDATGAVPPDR